MSYMSLYKLNGMTKEEREEFWASPKGKSIMEIARFNKRLNKFLKITGTALAGFVSYKLVSYIIWIEKCMK